MNTRKIAITIPIDLVMTIDSLSLEIGISRSKFITEALREKITEDKNASIKATYDRIFSDESIAREQLDIAGDFESSGKNEGQEW